MRLLAAEIWIGEVRLLGAKQYRFGHWCHLVARAMFWALRSSARSVLRVLCAHYPLIFDNFCSSVTLRIRPREGASGKRYAME